MPVPQSSQFSVCDWNSRAAATTSPTDRTLLDGSDGFFQYADPVGPGVVGEGGAVVLLADATKLNGAKDLVVRATVPLAVPAGSFTFEFDVSFSLEMLPDNFADPANRLFVAAVGQDGFVAGILFSKQGLALASHAEELSPTLLSGATDVMYGDDGALAGPLTVRVNVDALVGRSALYVSRTGEAYSPETGGDLWADNPDLSLRNNVQSRRGDGQYQSGIVLQASAQSLDKVLAKSPTATAQATAFAIYSLRVHDGLTIPLERPVAVLSAASQVVTGATAVLDGRSSYSKTLGQLSFAWELESAPDGSRALLDGAVRAVARVEQDLVVTYLRPTARANQYVVTLLAATDPLDPVEISFSDGVLLIRLAVQPGMGGALEVVTTAGDVLDAFRNPTNPSFDPTLLRALDVRVGPSGGSAPLPTGTFPFSGGSGSNLPTTRLVPDVPGLYVVSLVVLDGSRPSLKVRHSLLAAVTEQLLGHRPNTQYLFRHISDFWNLVPDKAQVETIWSAITQAVSAEVLAAWQHDYSKSIRDISRLYQRRWRHYPTFRERTEHYDLIPGHLPAPLVAVFQANTTRDVTVCRVVRVVTPDLFAPLAAGNKVLLRSSLGAPLPLTVESVSLVQANLDGTREWSIVFREFAPYHEKLGSSRAGRAIPNPSIAGPQASSTWFTSAGYTLSSARVGDIIRIWKGKQSLLYSVADVNPVVAGQRYENVVVLNAPVGVDGLPIEWDHLRPADGVFLESPPYFRYLDETNLADEPFGLGDFVEVALTVPTSGISLTTALPIEAQDGVAVMLGWRPLLALLDQVSPGGPDPAFSPRGWGLEDLPTLSLQLLRFRHARLLPADKELLSVPVLGDTLAAQLYENTDYRVEPRRGIAIKPWCAGVVETVAQSDIVTFLPSLTTVFHVDFSHDLDLTDMARLGATTLVLEKGDAGCYTIVGKGPQPNQYVVDRPVRTSAVCLAHLPRLHHANTGPQTYWAEVSFFSNDRAIEGNFGLYVGLPKSLLEQQAGEVDYLSVVRSMWFAFMNGPTLGNLRLPLQALLGLPITDQAGQIVRIVDPTPEETGLVVVMDRNGFQHTHEVPVGVQLAVNPSTGRPLREFPDITLGGLPRDMVEATVWLLQGAVARPAEQLRLLGQQLLEQGAQGDLQGLGRWMLANHLTVPTRRDLYEEWVRAIPAPLLADDYLDAQVTAYTSLTQPVRVEDYLSDPALVDGVLQGQDSLRKFHTFVVEIPLSLARSTSVLQLMDRFLDEARAAHTDYILFGKLGLEEDVVVADEVRKFPTLRLVDSPSSSPYMAKSTTPPGGATRIPLDLENQLWPAEGATLAFQPPFQGGQPLSTPDHVGDVMERYEAGYVEGRLDTFSGDGSLNPQVTPAWVDPVNQLDQNDVDVCRSKMWVPIEKLPDGLDFQIGEKLELLDDSLDPITTVWGISPPVVEHVGVGVNPRLPGVSFLQQDHRFTYLWLGFAYDPDPTYDCLGTEARLDALLEAATAVGLGNVRIRGVTSQATARPLEAPDRADPAFHHHFHLDRIFRVDKAADYGPEDQVRVTLVQYLPFGGRTIQAFRDASDTFDDPQYRQEVQTRPYRPDLPEDEQFIPSMGPGCYTRWTGTTPATDKVNWGYGFPNPSQQDLSLHPLAIDDFTQTANPALENLHFGLTLASKKGLQFSQGFTQFDIPAPSIKRVRRNSDTQIRIEGNFLIAPESGATAGPTTFSGVLGGSWVFIRPAGDEDTDNWISATGVTFETGTGNSTTVLGVPNVDQTSTGHVLVVNLPTGFADGTYDVVVRHYRPYPPVQLHMDTAILAGELTFLGGALAVDYFEQPF